MVRRLTDYLLWYQGSRPKKLCAENQIVHDSKCLWPKIRSQHSLLEKVDLIWGVGSGRMTGPLFLPRQIVSKYVTLTRAKVLCYILSASLCDLITLSAIVCMKLLMSKSTSAMYCSLRFCILLEVYFSILFSCKQFSIIKELDYNSLLFSTSLVEMCHTIN